MRVLRERVLAPLVQVGVVQRMILERAAELGVGYRNGALAQDHEAPFPLSRTPGRNGNHEVSLLGWLRFSRGPHSGVRQGGVRRPR
jgi:hypothetical protein